MIARLEGTRPMPNPMTRRHGALPCRALIPVLLIALTAVPGAASPLRLPPTTKTKLKNGLTVIVMPTARLPLVDFRLVARAGAVNDPAGKEGLASLTADLLTQGAGRRNAREIAEAIAFVGGTLEAAASSEQLVVTCEVLKKDFGTGLELMRDCIVSPTFPAEEFQRKKEETLGAIAAGKDDPSTVADRALLPFLMQTHPLAHPAVGWEKSVGSLTRDDVTAFHRERMTPDNAMLAVVGDVDAKAVIAALEKSFAGWKPSGHPAAGNYSPLPKSGRQVRIVSKPEVTQTQIRMACVGVPRNHPDYYPILVANTILGSGFTSRLTNEIRVVQGLTYSIGSRFNMYRNAGTFGVTTFTRNETLRKTIDETLKVIDALVSTGPSEAELDKARRYITGQFPLGLQAPDALAARLLDIEFYGLEPNYLETFSGRVDAVTMPDVKRVLHEHFCVDQLKILVVSKPDVAKKALAGLGAVDVKEIE
jgi:zinc protease